MGSSFAGSRTQRTIAGIVADETAFRAWYDAELAQELTQQTFVDAVRAAEASMMDDGIGWVIVIARRRLADHFRSLERRERGLLRLLVREPREAVGWLGDRDPDHELADALRQLPAAQRAAVVLCYLDD